MKIEPIKGSRRIRRVTQKTPRHFSKLLQVEADTIHVCCDCGLAHYEKYVAVQTRHGVKLLKRYKRAVSWTHYFRRKKIKCH